MEDETGVLGKRIIYEGFYGTVRYYGQVPSTTGEWYGMEWDDETRGKHDGTIDGVKYFECSHPMSGSFVRPRKINFGITVIEALQQKYGKSELTDQDMYVVGTKNQMTAVEMVGAESVQEQQSCFDRVQEVVLRDLAVRGPDKDTKLHELAPNIKELDLARNLLCKWEDVADITKEMKNLNTLIVSENILKLHPEPSVLASSFSTVTELYLNKMNLTWSQVELIITMFPHLEVLHLRHNKITNLRSMEGQSGRVQQSRFENIKMLNLDGNQLSDWNEILSLSSLPQLNSLILNGNQITEIHFGENSGGCNTTAVFVSLQSLSLSKNNIKDISSINALNYLPSLVQLRFKDNPLFKGETSFTSRQELIARVATLKTVNSSHVTEKERQAAERAYIKKYAKDWVNGGGRTSESDFTKLKPEFVEKHPRYTELIKAHGPPEEESLNKGSRTLKDSLITVTIKCPDAPDKKNVSKKLPGTMTIGKFKGLLYRLYKVDSADQRLSYLDTKNDREIQLDDDLRQLNFYSVVSGDTVYLRW